MAMCYLTLLSLRNEVDVPSSCFDQQNVVEVTLHWFWAALKR